jgi:hypothetical protein
MPVREYGLYLGIPSVQATLLVLEYGLMGLGAGKNRQIKSKWIKRRQKMSQLEQQKVFNCSHSCRMLSQSVQIIPFISYLCTVYV